MGDFMERYEQFKDIKIEESGLLLNNGKDTLYNRLQLNDIVTLADLFKKYDNRNIHLGRFANTSLYFQDEALKSRIELIRYKYLDTSLSFEDILDESISIPSNLYPAHPEYCVMNKRNHYYASKLGLTNQMTDRLLRNISNHETLIELIRSEYEKAKCYDYLTLSRQMYIRILELLVNYYAEKMINTNKGTRQEFQLLLQKLRSLEAAKADIEEKISQTKDKIKQYSKK